GSHQRKAPSITAGRARRRRKDPHPRTISTSLQKGNQQRKRLLPRPAVLVEEERNPHPRATSHAPTDMSLRSGSRVWRLRTVDGVPGNSSEDSVVGHPSQALLPVTQGASFAASASSSVADTIVGSGDWSPGSL
ncbi:hypothetical protein Taro_045056, partial [Colocasia esculenta]|nr:hypothetical protein [Colocasia esculenta]